MVVSHSSWVHCLVRSEGCCQKVHHLPIPLCGRPLRLYGSQEGKERRQVLTVECYPKVQAGAT